MAKNIVVFSDGTGQEGGKGNNTNVYKLFNMVEDRTARQVSFYDRGLGTGWRKLSGTVGGAGVGKNIMECYQFIFENFEAGDRIFLFGFSRGATTVRALSGMLHLFGILPKSRPELVPEAYQIYLIKNDSKRQAAAKAFVERHHTMWTKVHFIGVWDTVAALGTPIKPISVLINKVPFLKFRFRDLKLSKSVVHARHALAIDEERKSFLPELWDAEIAADQTLKQVWFPGMHSDVGGGYAEQTLSDIPLVWLVNEAVEHGLRIYPRHGVQLEPDPNGAMHDSRGNRLQKLYRRQVRAWNAATHGKPVIHASVLERSRDQNNQATPRYHAWILAQEYTVEPWPQHQHSHPYYPHINPS